MDVPGSGGHPVTEGEGAHVPGAGSHPVAEGEAAHFIEHPPYEIAPPFDTMGLRHVEEALRDLPFPATTSQLLQRAGNWRIPITGTHFHRLDEFFAGIGELRFRTPAHVVEAMAKQHPELRERSHFR